MAKGNRNPKAYSHVCRATCRHTCGDNGGRTKDGKPCRRLAGEGVREATTGHMGFRCKAHEVLALVPAVVEDKLAALPTRWRRFVEEYCGAARGNGAMAARRAGYRVKDAQSATAQAGSLLARPQIRAAVNAWMDELSMSAAEVTYHLTDLAGVTLAPFVEVVDPTGGVARLRLTKDVLRQYGHWIKSVRTDPKTGVIVRIELHDRHAALRDLAKIHKLYSDAPQVYVYEMYLQNMSDEELRLEYERARQEALQTTTVLHPN